MRCPGQDRRYWKEDAVFEVPCPHCGSEVELFKDDPSGRCTSCGHKFPNPGIDFGCAKWCPLAEACVGFVPQRQLELNTGQGALAARLIQAVKEEFEGQPARSARALMVFQHAKELVSREGGDARVVLAAALLLETGREPPGQGPEAASPPTGRTEGPSRARQVLQRIGLDHQPIEHVCHIIESHASGTAIDSIEFRIVRDSHTRANSDVSKKRGSASERGPRR